MTSSLDKFHSGMKFYVQTPSHRGFLNFWKEIRQIIKIKDFPYFPGRYCDDSCRKIIILSQLLLPEKWVKFAEFSSGKEVVLCILGNVVIYFWDEYPWSLSCI